VAARKKKQRKAAKAMDKLKDKKQGIDLKKKGSTMKK